MIGRYILTSVLSMAPLASAHAELCPEVGGHFRPGVVFVDGEEVVEYGHDGYDYDFTLFELKGISNQSIGWLVTTSERCNHVINDDPTFPFAEEGDYWYWTQDDPWVDSITVELVGSHRTGSPVSEITTHIESLVPSSATSHPSGYVSAPPPGGGSPGADSAHEVYTEIVPIDGISFSQQPFQEFTFLHHASNECEYVSHAYDIHQGLVHTSGSMQYVGELYVTEEVSGLFDFHWFGQSTLDNLSGDPRYSEVLNVMDDQYLHLDRFCSVGDTQTGQEGQQDNDQSHLPFSMQQ